MDKNIILAQWSKNVLCIICFTVLAVIFEKWWIILFSPLLFTYIDKAHFYYRNCDRCGKHSPTTGTPELARELAIENGWYSCNNTDYCPSCRKEMGL